MKKIALLLLAAVIITLLTPKRALIDSNWALGEVWTQETLVAPFDIPILKRSQDIAHEKEVINQNFQPIFRIDTVVGNRQARLTASLLRSEHSYSQLLSDSLTRILMRASAVGIISYTESQNYDDKIVRIADADNNMVAIPVSFLYTPEKIQAHLQALGVAVTLEQLFSNLYYDEKLNDQVRRDELDNISTTRSLVHSGETLIRTGEIVDAQTLQVLESFSLQYETQIELQGGMFELLFGRFLLIIILLIVNYAFFSGFANLYFGIGLKPWLFVLLLYVVMATFMAIVVPLSGVSPYIVPLPVVAIYLITYFNMRVAILGNLTVSIIAALFVRIPFDFFLVNFIGGMTAIYMMRHHYHRLNLFRAIGIILVSQTLVYISVSLIRDADFMAIKFDTIQWFVISAFLIIGFYQTVYMIERLFGFVSDVTLLELADTNQPLLLMLAEKAPGTFQHSVQVANLAEAAAKEIGANPLLARTGAMYHDMGKMENPFYYSENMTGVFNPHNDITPIESTAIIRRHVSDGITLAIKNRLPKQIIAFIERHHGTSKMYFFYAKELQINGKVVAESDFTYPGPRPVSKEVTICMMADAVEASSRSLKTYDKEPLEALVDKIIDTQIAGGQYSNSSISFAEVETIKTVFKAKLNTIYHGRISYPEQKG